MYYQEDSIEIDGKEKKKVDVTIAIIYAIPQSEKTKLAEKVFHNLGDKLLLRQFISSKRKGSKIKIFHKSDRSISSFFMFYIMEKDVVKLIVL